MSIPRATSFTFISLLFLLLHVLVPVIALPVQSRPSLAPSLDTPSFAQHDTALLKRSRATLLDSSLFLAGSSSLDSVPVTHNPPISSRVYARTFLDPHATAQTSSPSPRNGDTPTGYRVASKLDRRSIFDKIREGFQNFGKKVKEGFQNFGNKVKQGFQKVKTAFQTAGAKIKQGFQTAGAKIKQGFQTAGAKIKQGFQTAGAKIKQGFQKVGKAFQTAGAKIKQGFQTFGNKVKQGFQKVKQGFQTFGNKVKQGFQKVKEGFQTAGKKIKEGFQTAGKWVKENAGKVAKFGLKILSTAASVAGHVVSFIPGVGKVVGKAFSGISKLTSFASDKIHADLGDKLNKGMSVMDKIEHPVGGAAGQVLDAILKRDVSSTWKKDA